VEGFPDLHIEPGRHLHTDDAVFVEVVFSGTQRVGRHPGHRPLGQRPHRLPLRVDEDRLVCERVWFDFAMILRQLGILTS
jgi:hypothetical protein